MQCTLVIFFGNAQAYDAELQPGKVCHKAIIGFFRALNGASGY
jgi:hypothetical protein